MANIYPRVTPDRLRYMRELTTMGVGEPYVRGTTRNHLLRLGWIEGVIELPDGRRMPWSAINEQFPPGSNERLNGRFVGVTMTFDGQKELAKFAAQQTPGA